MPRYLYPAPDSNGEEDLWLGDDASYNINAFYTSAGQDSESPRIRVSSKQMAIIGNLVASREIPDYKTAADFIRDAIYHRLYWWQHVYQHPHAGRIIRVEMELERSKERIAASQMFDEAIKSFKDEFQLSLTQKNRAGAEDALERVRRCLDSEEADDTRLKAELERLEAYMRMELGTWR